MISILRKELKLHVFLLYTILLIQSLCFISSATIITTLSSTSTSSSTKTSEHILHLTFTSNSTLPMSSLYFIQDSGDSYFTSALESSTLIDSYTYMSFNLIDAKSWEYVYDIIINNSTNINTLTSTITASAQSNLKSMIKALPVVNETISVDIATTLTQMETSCEGIVFKDKSTNETSVTYPCGEGYCILCDTSQPCSTSRDCIYKSSCQDNFCSMLINSSYSIWPARYNFFKCIIQYVSYFVIGFLMLDIFVSY